MKYNLFFINKSVFNTKIFLDMEENIKISQIIHINHISQIRLIYPI